MIADKILNYLTEQERTINEAIRYELEKIAGACFKRQFMTSEESHVRIRLSGAGKCPRQLAYQYHDIEKAGKEMNARSSITFWTGDLTEFTIISLAKMSGCRIVATGLNQITCKLQFTLNNNGDAIEYDVFGHPDGILFDDEIYLVEVKSMSDYGYKDFEKGIINEEYLTQVNMYMEALHLNKCIFIALNKNSGVLNERIITKDNTLVKEGMENINKVLCSDIDNLPEPRYTYDKKTRFYPWNCCYCSWFKICHPTAKLVLVGRANKLKEMGGLNEK